MTKSAEPSTPSGSSETQQRRRQITSYKNTTTSPATDSCVSEGFGRKCKRLLWQSPRVKAGKTRSREACDKFCNCGHFLALVSRHHEAVTRAIQRSIRSSTDANRPRFLLHHLFIGRLQSFSDGWPLLAPRLDAEMERAQFFHEFGPHFRATFTQQLGADAEFFTDRQIFETPARHLRQDRQQFDALFGERVGSLLLVTGVIGPCDDALVEQRLEPVGEDIRGNALFGFRQ